MSHQDMQLEIARGRTRAGQLSSRSQLGGILWEYQRFTSDEARAAFCDRWTRVAARDMDDCWTILYDALRIIRDQHLYANAAVMEGGLTFDSFAAYFEAIVKQPFATFAQLESTYHTIEQVAPEVIHRLSWTEARTLAVQQRATGPIPLNPDGVKLHDITCVNNTGEPMTRGSTNADYLTARIARDRPDILARMKAGEFRSVRAAAKEAGIVRPTATFYTDIPRDAARAIKRHFRGIRLFALIEALEEDG